MAKRYFPKKRKISLQLASVPYVRDNHDFCCNLIFFSMVIDLKNPYNLNKIAYTPNPEVFYL